MCNSGSRPLGVNITRVMGSDSRHAEGVRYIQVRACYIYGHLLRSRNVSQLTVGVPTNRRLQNKHSRARQLAAIQRRATGDQLHADTYPRSAVGATPADGAVHSRVCFCTFGERRSATYVSPHTDYCAAAIYPPTPMRSRRAPAHDTPNQWQTPAGWRDALWASARTRRTQQSARVTTYDPQPPATNYQPPSVLPWNKQEGRGGWGHGPIVIQRTGRNTTVDKCDSRRRKEEGRKEGCRMQVRHTPRPTYTSTRPVRPSVRPNHLAFPPSPRRRLIRGGLRSRSLSLRIHT